jgi:hypothetical protein
VRDLCLLKVPRRLILSFYISIPLLYNELYVAASYENYDNENENLGQWEVITSYI